MSSPEEEFAVVITALHAGKIDGAQALAASVALHRRLAADERAAIIRRLYSMRHAWGGDAAWFTNGNHVSQLAVDAVEALECDCGCPLGSHVGEIGCSCGEAHVFQIADEQL